MLKDTMKQASYKYVEGLINEQEYAIELIKALGKYTEADSSITDIAFCLNDMEDGL